MSDSANGTWSGANTTPKFGTTNRTPQERLSAVEIALMENHHTSSNPENPNFEIKAWEVQLLAEGGKYISEIFSP